MHPNKIKVGQRVRAVLTETSGPVPLCEGKVIVVDDSGNALVEYDDGWSRWYHRPTVELIDPEEKDTPQWDGHLLLEIERLREENAKLKERAANGHPGHLYEHTEKGLHLSILYPTGVVGLVKLSSGNTYPLSILTEGDWSYVGESEGRNWQ